MNSSFFDTTSEYVSIPIDSCRKLVIQRIETSPGPVRRLHTSFYRDGFFYVCGGLKGGDQYLEQSYSPEMYRVQLQGDRKWRKVPQKFPDTFDGEFCGASLLDDHGRIILYGGRRIRETFATMHTFDPLTLEWRSIITNESCPVSSHMAWFDSTGRYMYTYGGFNFFSGYIPNLTRFDLSGVSKPSESVPMLEDGINPVEQENGKICFRKDSKVVFFGGLEGHKVTKKCYMVDWEKNRSYQLPLKNSNRIGTMGHNVVKISENETIVIGGAFQYHDEGMVDVYEQNLELLSMDWSKREVNARTVGRIPLSFAKAFHSIHPISNDKWVMYGGRDTTNRDGQDNLYLIQLVKKEFSMCRLMNNDYSHEVTVFLKNDKSVTCHKSLLCQSRYLMQELQEGNTVTCHFSNQTTFNYLLTWLYGRRNLKISRIDQVPKLYAVAKKCEIYDLMEYLCVYFIERIPIEQIFVIINSVKEHCPNSALKETLALFIRNNWEEFNEYDKDDLIEFYDQKSFFAKKNICLHEDFTLSKYQTTRTFKEHVHYLYKSKQLANVVLYPNDSLEGFKCHKEILALYSDYYRVLFYRSEFGDCGKDTVREDFVDSKNLKALLSYMYLGENATFFSKMKMSSLVELAFVANLKMLFDLESMIYETIFNRVKEGKEIFSNELFDELETLPNFQQFSDYRRRHEN